MFSVIFVQLLQNSNTSAYKFSMDTNIPQSLISNWKKGTKTPSFENILKIANYFNVSADYLLGRTDIPDNPNLKPQDKEECLA